MIQAEAFSIQYDTNLKEKENLIDFLFKKLQEYGVLEYDIE